MENREKMKFADRFDGYIRTASRVVENLQGLAGSKGLWQAEQYTVPSTPDHPPLRFTVLNVRPQIPSPSIRGHLDGEILPLVVHL